MFDVKSRYANVPTYTVMDHRGRQVEVVSLPSAPVQTLLGIHRLLEGERMDHLAARYLRNPTGFWRIAEQNDVMLAEALSEFQEIEIPERSR